MNRDSTEYTSDSGQSRMWRATTLRGKFLRILLPVVVLCTIFVSAAFAYFNYRDIDSEITRKLSDYANVQAEILAPALWNYNMQVIERSIDILKLDSDLNSAIVKDGRGVVIAAMGISSEGETLDTLQVTVDLTYPGPTGKMHKIGSLTLGISKDRIRETILGQMARDSIFLLLLVFAISASAMYANRTTVGLPLEKLIGAIRRARKEGVKQTVEWPENDEMGELVSNYNELVASLDAKERELSLSEKKFRDLFNNAQVGIIVTSVKEGTVVNANRRMAKIFGFDNELKLMAHFNMAENYVNPAARIEMIDLLREKRRVINYSLEMYHKSGRMVVLEISAQINENDTLISGAVEDITERIKMQSELVQAKEEAEAATHAKSDFLARMSHEIRTPLNAVVGLSDLALHADSWARTTDYISKIKSSGRILLRVINDILDFSKIEAGMMELEHVEFDLNETLTLVSDVTHKMCGKNVEMIFSVDKLVPSNLIGDSLRLGQVLTNLVNNATKFTEQGEISIDIDVHEQSQEHVELSFSVSDTGIGMSPEQLESVFDSFSQADESITRHYGGTGLGLPICKHLVELLGGEIKATSILGGGSSFTFSSTFDLPSPSSDFVGDSFPGTDMSALVVDDNPRAREAVATMLAHEGFMVESATTAQEALGMSVKAAMGGTPYDIVLADVRMPGMSGMELLHQIKALDLVKEVPLMVMDTIDGLAELQSSLLGIKPDGFLSKPVLPSNLIYSLKVVLLGEKERRSYGRADAIPVLSTLNESHVLLVEDNVINQLVAIEYLEKMGMKVDLATNGSEALTAVQEKAYQLVFMDIQMPVMDGLEATRRIREFKSDSVLPIIGMTAQAMSGDREAALEAGMDDYMTKPIIGKELAKMLRRWVGESDVIIPEVQPQNTESIPLSSDEIIDMEAALSLVEGDMAFIVIIMGKFIEEHAFDPEKLEEALAANDIILVRRLAHTLKSVSENIGAVALRNHANALEEAVRSDDLTNLSGLVADVASTMEKTLSSLEQILSDANG